MINIPMLRFVSNLNKPIIRMLKLTGHRNKTKNLAPPKQQSLASLVNSTVINKLVDAVNKIDLDQ